MPSLNTKIIAPVAFILLWGSSALFLKDALQYDDAVVFLLFRFLFVFAVIAPIYFLSRKKFPSLEKSQILKTVKTGILLQFGYQFFCAMCLRTNVSPGLIGIILALQPIATVLLIREERGLLQWLGLILGFSGLILIIYRSIFVGQIMFSGMLYAFLALACITFGTLSQKKYCSQVPLTQNLMFQFSSSLILASLFFIIYSPQIHLTESFLVATGWMAIVVTVSANYILYHLLKTGSAAKITSYFYFIPFVTVFFDYLIFHHKLPLISIFGMLLIILGVYMLNTLSPNKNSNSKPIEKA